jgi:segregation and condensation protein A
VRKRTVWSLAEARVALEKLVGQSLDWSPLDQYLIAYLVEPSMVPTVLASTFAAALELIREGHLEAHQQGSFTPLYLRKKQGGDGGGSTGVMSAESGNA